MRCPESWGREAFVWGAADAAESILLLLGLAIFSTFTRYNLGFGDIKLLGTMALYQGAEKTLACLLYGLFLAACISLLLLAVRRINHKDKLPLAPFFLAGYLLLLWKSC